MGMCAVHGKSCFPFPLRFLTICADDACKTAINNRFGLIGVADLYDFVFHVEFAAHVDRPSHAVKIVIDLLSSYLHQRMLRSRRQKQVAANVASCTRYADGEAPSAFVVVVLLGQVGFGSRIVNANIGAVDTGTEPPRTETNSIELLADINDSAQTFHEGGKHGACSPAVRGKCGRTGFSRSAVGPIP